MSLSPSTTQRVAETVPPPTPSDSRQPDSPRIDRPIEKEVVAIPIPHPDDSVGPRPLVMEDGVVKEQAVNSPPKSDISPDLQEGGASAVAGSETTEAAVPTHDHTPSSSPVTTSSSVAASVSVSREKTSKTESRPVESNAGTGDVATNGVDSADTKTTNVLTTEGNLLVSTTTVESESVEKRETGEVLKEKKGEEVRDEEEKAPIPPPRRKRKHKKLNKQPSLENLDVSFSFTV